MGVERIGMLVVPLALPRMIVALAPVADVIKEVSAGSIPGKAGNGDHAHFNYET